MRDLSSPLRQGILNHKTGYSHYCTEDAEFCRIQNNSSFWTLSALSTAQYKPQPRQEGLTSPTAFAYQDEGIQLSNQLFP